MERLKTSWKNNLTLSLPAKMKVFFEKEKPLAKQKLNFSGSAFFLMETTVSLNCFLNYSLSKQFLASNLP